MRPLFASLVISLLSLPLLAQGPVVFVDGNGAEQDAARATKFAKMDDQTMEMTRDLLKSCPEISLTRKDGLTPDYYLLLNRGEEYGLFKNAASQVMLLDADKNVLFSAKKGTVAQASKAGCKAILADWKTRRPQTAQQKTDPQKNGPPPQWQASQK
jgi:hypothetical protein